MPAGSRAYGSRRSSRFVRRLAALAITLPLLGCPQLTEVVVVEGSTASDLRFRVADPSRRDVPLLTGIGVLRPNEADDSEVALWAIRPSEGADPVEEFRFGVLPVGFEAFMDGPTEAPELVPGCYEVRITGTGRAWFVVEADGAVMTDTESCGSEKAPKQFSVARNDFSTTRVQPCNRGVTGGEPSVASARSE